MSCFLYWIRDRSHDDIFTQGYVGISYDPHYRLRQHVGNAKSTHHRQHPVFKSCLASGDFVNEVVLESTRDYCLNIKPNTISTRLKRGWTFAEALNGKRSKV